MKVLLHTCCGPCAIFPVRALRADGMAVTGFFYPHNIHPYTECIRRQETLRTFAGRVDLPLICENGYDLEGFLRKVVHREEDRCTICYQERLLAAARLAKNRTFDCFTTSLLYSRFQKHDIIRQTGESIGRAVGVPFLYRDFRTGWNEGVQESKRMGLYRQQYCGCIYSEKERFFKMAP
ncbi:MAG: epoxyqueuosine reductase QueH [Deltaproteobacteria bacterium]|nr:epoxyqueuosine reductase QueH [Deltaproteobacteria bacterium]